MFKVLSHYLSIKKIGTKVLVVAIWSHGSSRKS